MKSKKLLAIDLSPGSCCEQQVPRPAPPVAQMQGRHRKRAILLLLVSLSLLLAGCGRRSAQPAPTPTSTALPTVAPTATATAGTDGAGETTAEVGAATAQTIVPADFRPIEDAARGYALALPPGWTQIDLRGEQVQGMIRRVGMEQQAQPLFDFLASPAGRAVGVVAATDLTGMIFGGLPTALNVAVIETPNVTPDEAAALVQAWLANNPTVANDVTVEAITPTSVNGLPAVRATLTADLAAYGVSAPLYVEAVGLLANEQLYLLTLATPADKRAENAEQFAEIIGTFGPN